MKLAMFYVKRQLEQRVQEDEFDFNICNITVEKDPLTIKNLIHYLKNRNKYPNGVSGLKIKFGE